MPIIIKIKTWSCACGYKQDFDPADESLMELHFPKVPAGFCPACWQGQNPEKSRVARSMFKEINPDKKTTITIADDAEIDALKLTKEEIESRKQKAAESRKKFAELEDKD